MKRMSTLRLTKKLAISVRLSATPTECALKQATNRGSEIVLAQHEDLSGMEIRLFLSILVLILRFDRRKGERETTGIGLAKPFGLSLSQMLIHFLTSADVFCCMNV